MSVAPDLDDLVREHITNSYAISGAETDMEHYELVSERINKLTNAEFLNVLSIVLQPLFTPVVVVNQVGGAR